MAPKPTQARNKEAGTPFDKPKADVVFTTSDKVDFRIYKAILEVASPFFADMFSLTQSDSATEPIVISEDSVTFDHLMRLCYPVEDPIIESFQEIENVLEAAMKYQMAEATKIVLQWLGNWLRPYPLQVYGIACRQNVEREARLAAVEWKRQNKYDAYATVFSSTIPGASYVPEMASITAGAYFRLLDFIRNNRDPSTMTFVEPSSNSDAAASENEIRPGAAPHPTNGLPNPDIILMSVDGVSLPTHTLLLRLASADRLIELATCDERSDKPPVARLDLDSRTIEDMLALCHPFHTISLADPVRMLRVLHAATKYNISRIVGAMRHAISLIPSSDPVMLSVYFIAAEFGWDVEAKTAAKFLATQRIENVYSPIMEHTSAAAYHSLMQYHHACGVAIESVVSTEEHAPSRGTNQWTDLLDPTTTTNLAWRLVAAEEMRYLCLQRSTSDCRWCGQYMGYSTSGAESHIRQCRKLLSNVLEKSDKLNKTLEEKLSEVEYIGPTPPQ